MDTTDMVEPVQDVQENMDKHKRYYILHREEANARRLIRYHNNPKVIAKNIMISLDGVMILFRRRNYTRRFWRIRRGIRHRRHFRRIW